MASLRCACVRCKGIWALDVDNEDGSPVHDPTDVRVANALKAAKDFATAFDGIGGATATHRGCDGDIAAILLCDEGSCYPRRPVTAAGESVLRSEIDARERRKKK